MSNIMGIDSSLSSTGYAIKDDKNKIIAYGKITTTNKTEENHRMYYIVNELIKISKEFKVTKSYMESQFSAVNKKVGLQLSRVRGAIVFGLLSYNDINTEYIAPATVRKLLLDNGKATKVEVYEKLMDILPAKTLLDIGPFNDKSGNKNKTSDIYDAISIILAIK